MTQEEKKANDILKIAEVKAKELLEKAAELARKKLNGFTEEDRTTLNVIDTKVTKVGEDINKVDKNDV